MSIIPTLNVEIPSGTDRERKRSRAMKLRNHFTEVSSQYKSLRELDLHAVHVISEALAINQRRPLCSSWMSARARDGTWKR